MEAGEYPSVRIGDLMMETIGCWIVAVLAIVLFFMARTHLRKKRFEALTAKYGDSRIVRSIMGKQIWKGATYEMVRDSLGRPISVDRKVMKTKTKEVWKYEQISRNRYALKVTFEDGEVVGWDRKGG